MNFRLFILFGRDPGHREYFPPTIVNVSFGAAVSAEHPIDSNSSNLKRRVEAPTQWTQGPRDDRENRENEGHDDVPHSVALHRMRYSRARHIEKDAGIRPFLEPRKTRREQGYRSNYLSRTR